MTAVQLAQRKLELEVDGIRHYMHRQRGEEFAPPTPNSAEWLNTFSKLIWSPIPPNILS